MHFNCLIVDDEEELAKMEAEYFRMFDISTEYVTGAKACYDFLEKNTADLMLLDINLGDGSGFEICKKVREKHNIPILFISARQSDDDVLVALSTGGDDYIKKPCSLAVLLAKVKINLKRAQQLKSMKEDREGGKDEDFCLDEPTMSVILKGRVISLKAKEFALLKCLYEHRNTIVTKDTLFDEVWKDTFYSDATLNVHIRKLREKIEENPNSPKLIKTVWGTGYMLEV
ncbi:MAG: response regulator transcription factor [Lachnospiraceae bacterium]|nr:response regulator transcription factor [Lachnospiraceae bacterium]